MKWIATAALIGMTLAGSAQEGTTELGYFSEGALDGQVYTSEELGWTIEVPEFWQLVPLEEIRGFQQRGLEAIEGVVDGQVEYSQLRSLIAFRQDPQNMFQSTSEVFYPGTQEEWKVNNHALKGIIYNAFANEGFRVDSTQTTTVKIDGVDFRTYKMTIFVPAANFYLYQEVFSTFRNGFDMGVSFTYTNERARKAMWQALKGSEFAPATNAPPKRLGPEVNAWLDEAAGREVEAPVRSTLGSNSVKKVKR